jgi:dihydrofolate reductase
MITILVAFDENRVIGNKGRLPWHIPEDLKLFKKRTQGHVVVMGRKTWESLPKKPLVGRTNIILSSHYVEIPDFHSAISTPIRIFNNLNESLGHLNQIFIIGGAQVYKSAMKIADRIIVSKVHGKFEGDTYFPKIGWSWRKKSIEHHSEFDVVEYRRISGIFSQDAGRFMPPTMFS